MIDKKIDNIFLIDLFFIQKILHLNASYPDPTLPCFILQTSYPDPTVPYVLLTLTTPYPALSYKFLTLTLPYPAG